MEALPEIRTEDKVMETHRRRLVHTIDNVIAWREEKNAEFPDDRTALRRGRRIIKALQGLAEYVESLPDDDSDLLLTYRAFSDGEEPGGSGYYLRQGLKTLGRYGLGFSSDPTDDDHSQFLRDLSSQEIQQKTMGDATRADRLIREIYKRVRQLRFLQDRASEDLANSIQNRLAAIWDGTFGDDEEDKE